MVVYRGYSLCIVIDLCKMVFPSPEFPNKEKLYTNYTPTIHQLSLFPRINVQWGAAPAVSRQCGPYVRVRDSPYGACRGSSHGGPLVVHRVHDGDGRNSIPCKGTNRQKGQSAKTSSCHSPYSRGLNCPPTTAGHLVVSRTIRQQSKRFYPSGCKSDVFSISVSAAALFAVSAVTWHPWKHR